MKIRKTLLTFVMFILSMVIVYGDNLGSLRVVSGTASTVYQGYKYGRYWPHVSMSQIQSETTLYNVSIVNPVLGLPNYFTEFRAIYRRADPDPLGYYWNQSRIEISSYQLGADVLRATNDSHDIPNEFFIPGIRPAWGTLTISTPTQRYIATQSATLLLTNFTDRAILFNLTTTTYGRPDRYRIVSPAVAETSSIRWRPAIVGGGANMVLYEWYCTFVPEDPYS
ncbi:MAG: hypothetical protein Q7R78_00405 [bacterium]|nr:hypothetical protein [bacterium]